MQIAFVNPEKCQRCNQCHAQHACPIGAIFRIDQDEPCIVETSLCHGCGDCTAPCPAHAITLKTR